MAVTDRDGKRCATCFAFSSDRVNAMISTVWCSALCISAISNCFRRCRPTSHAHNSYLTHTPIAAVYSPNGIFDRNLLAVYDCELFWLDRWNRFSLEMNHLNAIDTIAVVIKLNCSRNNVGLQSNCIISKWNLLCRINYAMVARDDSNSKAFEMRGSLSVKWETLFASNSNFFCNELKTVFRSGREISRTKCRPQMRLIAN